MLKKITIKNSLLWAILKLKRKNILSAQLDAELLLAYILKEEKEFLFTYPEKKLTAAQFNKYQNLIRRRLNSEPVAYLIGYKEFYGLDFKINKNVLVPRPETELMVELVTYNLKHETQENSKKIIVDIGTGSGNIIISIAKSLKNYDLEFKNYEFYGIDISQKALRLAQFNAKKHNVNKKIHFLKGDLLEPVIKNFPPKADQPRAEKFKIKNLIIIANLPYLTPIQYKKNKDLHFEPKSALDGGKDGLEYIERLFPQIKKLLVVSCLPKGDKLSVSVFIEIDPAQTKKIKTIIKKYFPQSELQIKKDLSDQNRLAIIKC